MKTKLKQNKVTDSFLRQHTCPIELHNEIHAALYMGHKASYAAPSSRPPFKAHVHIAF